MSRRTLALASILLLWSVSCEPIISVNGLTGGKGEVVEIPGFEGEWRVYYFDSGGGISEGENEIELRQLSVVKGGAGANVVYRTMFGPSEKAGYTSKLTPVRLQNSLFVDIEPDFPEDEIIGGFPYPYVEKLHTFGRIWMNGDALVIRLLDDEEFGKALEKQGITIPNNTEVGAYDLTIPTEELENIFPKIADSDAWKQEFIFCRENSDCRVSLPKLMVERDPQNARLWAALGAGYLEQDQPEEALGAFQQAAGFDASFRTRVAETYFVLGRYKEAAQEFASSRAQRTMVEARGTLWEHLSLLHEGKKGAANNLLRDTVKTYPSRPKASAWELILLRHHLGDLSEADLINLAGDSDERRKAHFYAGYHRLLQGDGAGARTEFQKLIGGPDPGPGITWECQAARARLAELGSLSAPTAPRGATDKPGAAVSH